VEKALGISNPDIFNTDQGVQFTKVEFTQRFSIRFITFWKGYLFRHIS
jgi:hypothetical protein